MHLYALIMNPDEKEHCGAETLEYRFESCIAHHLSIGKWRFNLGSTESRLARYKKGMIYNAGRAGKHVRPFYSLACG